MMENIEIERDVVCPVSHRRNIIVETIINNRKITAFSQNTIKKLTTGIGV